MRRLSRNDVKVRAVLTSVFPFWHLPLDIGVAEGAKNLPDTLRSFHYTNYLENMDAPNVLAPSGVDTLSISM